jgi:hypothetical protein
MQLLGAFITIDSLGLIYLFNYCRRKRKMKEIRIHGRGGQGSVTAAELLAVAAFEDGKYSQAFPPLGWRGEALR